MTTTNKTYRISAGYLNSNLRSAGRLRGHESVSDALATFARFRGISVADTATIKGGDGETYVYTATTKGTRDLTAEDARDEDDTGEHADAVIYREDDEE